MERRPLGERVEFLLGPFGFRIREGNQFYPRMLYWQTQVKASGQFWDGEQIDGEYELYEDDADKIAREILWAAHKKIMEPAPQAPEVDWRPSEAIPEDFYA